MKMEQALDPQLINQSMNDEEQCHSTELQSGQDNKSTTNQREIHACQYLRISHVGSSNKCQYGVLV